MILGVFLRVCIMVGEGVGAMVGVGSVNKTKFENWKKFLYALQTRGSTHLGIFDLSGWFSIPYVSLLVLVKLNTQISVNVYKSMI